jgi:copper chaperone CopZ
VTSSDALPDVPSSDDAGTAVVHLSVEGMHCGSCSALIEETLAEQAGVTTASVDLDAARAVVAYDPAQLDVDGIQAAIADAGYAATPVG